MAEIKHIERTDRLAAIYGAVMHKDNPLVKHAIPEETAEELGGTEMDGETPEMEAAEDAGELVHVSKNFLAELFRIIYLFVCGK